MSSILWLLILWALFSCAAHRPARRVEGLLDCLPGSRACWAIVQDPTAKFVKVLIEPEVQPGDCVCRDRGPVLRRCRC